MKAQRLRLRYRLSAPAHDLRPRDLADAWAASVTASGLIISMSESKRPVPQVALAATLPQSATSDCELIDVFLAEPVPPGEIVCRIAAHLPPGVEPLSAREIGVYAPSLQSQLRWAEYEVEVPGEAATAEEAKSAVERLLSAKTLPSEYVREKKTRAYDLRPLILDLRVEPLNPGGQAFSLTGGGEGDAGAIHLRMRLRAEQDNTGRVDQVLLALGLPPATRIHRTRLEVEETPAVLRAYRHGGERLVY